jgi:polar amino acid transport system substrate-binding protein
MKKTILSLILLLGLSYGASLPIAPNHEIETHSSALSSHSKNPTSEFGTTEEQKLIKKIPLRCIATGEWAPFNLVEHGKLVGIGLDYWHLVEKILNVKTDYIATKEWTEVLSSIKNRTADLTVAVQSTEKRLAYAAFSKPYASYPIVIVTKNDIGFIGNINLIKDKTIVVSKNYTATEILKKHYPLLRPKYTLSIDDALKQVNDGKAFATVGILPVVAYKLNEHAFPNLKISGSIEPRFYVSFMLRKDYAALLPLINKTIDAIKDEEREKINKKWVTLHYEERISRRYFNILLIGSAILFLFFAAWLYLLKREVSRKNSRTKELQKLVVVDALTSVYNRYMFGSALDKEIALYRRGASALSLIFFDIDGFKGINDTLGHKAGDTILKELATLVSQYVRKSDTFCRWGGDEFVIILPNTVEADAKELSEKLDQLIRKNRFSHHISLGCSFGVTQFRDEDTRLSIMSRIDQLLYESKKNRGLET